jgi:hypothetical protein
MMLVKTKEDIVAFLKGRQAGLRASNDAVDQLVEQLTQARRELRDARAWHLRQMSELKAYFDNEATIMRQELQNALSELYRFQMRDEFRHWQPNDTDRMQ